VKPFVFVLAIAILPWPAIQNNNVDGFIGRVYTNGRGERMPYRLFVPAGYNSSKKYPLLLWLHGAGSVGNDNRKQISGASISGTHTWTSPKTQSTYPAFVVAPQAPAGTAWANFQSDELGAQLSLVLAILDSIRSEFSIDSQRMYVAGQSMGGYGTWDLITKKPGLFAAAIPLCGGGRTDRAGVLLKTPIWAFHGDADDTVPVSKSRDMISAIRKLGGSPRYTEYKGVGHNVWTRAFLEPGLLEWVFSQHN
jgi:predicted peptidase